MSGEERKRRESWWTIAAAVGQISSALVGAWAAFVAAQALEQTSAQGVRQEEQAATVQTLTFFATFNGESMLDIRNNIAAQDWCVRDGVVDPYEGYRLRVTSEQATSFVDFFDAVHACSVGEDGEQREGMCNMALARQLFGPYAREYYDELAHTIVSKRGDRGDQFGRGMAALAGIEESAEQVRDRYHSSQCRVARPAAPAAPAAGEP